MVVGSFLLDQVSDLQLYTYGRRHLALWPVLAQNVKETPWKQNKETTSEKQFIAITEALYYRFAFVL